MKNLKVVLFATILIVIALAGLVSAFLLNYNTYSPSKPLVLDDGENIYISTSLNNNYNGYRFKFKDSQNNEITIDSDKNVVNANELIEKGIKIGENYKISICYTAKNEGNNSEYSEETDWKCKMYLSPTTINYDSENNLLTWLKIDNADFYRIYYNAFQGEVYIDTTELQLDLNDFETGEKIMYIVAHSNDSNYKPSVKSNILEFKLKHYLCEFSTISFDKETKILTAENEELLEKLEIYLDNKNYSNIKFEVSKVEETYLYKIDLSLIYNGETTIGISPSDVDEYNVFNGEIKMMQISA